MRIKVEIEGDSGITLPFNYNYPVSAMLYDTIGRHDYDYAQELHEKGRKAGRKRFKMFVF